MTAADRFKSRLLVGPPNRPATAKLKSPVVEPVSYYLFP